MKNYFLKRTFLIIPTLIGISLITFFIIHLSPGDPVSLNQGGMLSSKMSIEDIERIRKIYGLDKPIYIQYINWLKRIVTLDFGNSFQDGRPVIERIKERLPVTLTLNIISMIIIYTISIFIGLMQAKYYNSKFDKISSIILFILYSLPGFWVALLLIMFFGVKLNLFPIYGITSDNFSSLTFWEKIIDIIKHITLPIIVMVYGEIAYLSRFVRNTTLEVLKEEYILTARAKGLSENKVLFKHAFRNALIPIVTLLSSTLPALIGGSVIIESTFSLPGIGLLYYESILSRDYPVIMGLSFITAFLTLIGLVLGDFLYKLVDPRISFEGKKI